MVPTNEERREADIAIRNAGTGYASIWQWMIGALGMLEESTLPKVRYRLVELIEPELTYKDIVMCRDCKNYKPAEDEYNEDECALANAYTFNTSPDWFCAFGERKDDDN